jgi:hypothetical protein
MSNTTEYYVSKANLSAVITKIETKLNNRYTKAETDSAISSAISGVTQFDYQLVDDQHPLPQTGTKGIIYLVPNNDPGSTNTYNEKIWIVIDGTGRYEDLGKRDLDLSSYLVSADVKVDGTTIIKTPDASGNGFTLSAQAATTVSDGTGIDVTHTGSDYEVALDTATQTSLGKADTAVQKADIKGTTDQVTVTPDVSGNGVTISLDAAIVSGAAAGATALQPGDIEPLSTSDVNDLLALITDDPVSNSGSGD